MFWLHAQECHHMLFRPSTPPWLNFPKTILQPWIPFGSQSNLHYEKGQRFMHHFCPFYLSNLYSRTSTKIPEMTHRWAFFKQHQWKHLRFLVKSTHALGAASGLPMSCGMYDGSSRAAGPVYWILLTSSGVPVSTMRRVALRPCGQVAPLGVLLLALRVAATTVVRHPPGVALLRVAHPSTASVHEAPVTNRVPIAIAPNVTVHAEMIKARPRPRPSSWGVHGWSRGGR